MGRNVDDYGHFFLIPVVFEHLQLYNLPTIFREAIDKASTSTTPVKNKKEVFLEKALTSKEIIPEDILSELDQKIIDLDKHFSTNDKLMYLSIEEQEKN
nr:hypothetical protein [Endozoicomonas sp.]